MAEKRTTIADIAAELHVSLHTVNKALYGKKGVGEATRQRVLDMAAKLDYQVNRVAQSMARNPLLIGVLCSREWQMVGDDFRKGVDAALGRLRDYNVQGKYYHTSSRSCRGEVAAALAQAVADGVNALVCNHVLLDAGQAKFLAGHEIPFASLGTEQWEKQRLACVRSDGAMAGRLAAELLGFMLPPGAAVAVMTASRDYLDCEDKVLGFLQESSRFQFEVAGVYEHFDQPEKAAQLVDRALAERPDLRGVYATTANSPTMCRRVVELGLQDQLAIIATDLYGDIRMYLRDGVVKASLYQDCVREGERIIELIYAHLCEGQDVSAPVLVPPLVVLRNNLTIF